MMVLIAGLSSCKKNNDAPAVPQLTTNLNLINASADTINFYLNGTRLNKNSNLYPVGSSGYFDVYYGTQNYQVKKIFSTLNNKVQPLFTKSLTLDTSTYYSLFIAGETEADAFLTTDDLQSDTLENTSLVRFVNASPDEGTFEVSIGDTLRFQDFSYKQQSDFISVASGNRVVKLFHSGSTVPVATLTVPMASEAILTLYAKGKATGKGNAALGIGSTQNGN